MIRHVISKTDNGVTNDVLCILNGGQLQVEMSFQTIFIKPFKYISILTHIRLTRETVKLRNESSNH